MKGLSAPQEAGAEQVPPIRSHSVLGVLTPPRDTAHSWQVNTWSQRAALPGRAGLTPGRDNKLLELLKVSVQVPEESEASPPLTALETWGPHHLRGKQLQGSVQATGTSHPDATLEVDFQAWTSRICSQGHRVSWEGRGLARCQAGRLATLGGQRFFWLLGNIWLPTAHPAWKTRCCSAPPAPTGSSFTQGAGSPWGMGVTGTEHNRR